MPVIKVSAMSWLHYTCAASRNTHIAQAVTVLSCTESAHNDVAALILDKAVSASGLSRERGRADFFF